MIRILLADDRPQVRSALRLLLDFEPVFEVVGEATNTKDLGIEMQVTYPDLLLLDWDLPGLANSDFLSVLRTEYPALSIVALSGDFEAHQAALAAGVDAFISKGYPSERLLTTLYNFNVRNDTPIPYIETHRT